MIKIGMLIGDRYEILEKIGTGGMSDVYKAKCHKLNRFVAIKVLKQEFNENTNFVSKFRIEAQAAAGLAHPNIVNVYDVGEEEGIYYIVMELVEGITLKNYIEKKARLSVKEAVSIAIQVSMGIEAAHNNNIIHRDIKPQNIMIARDGKVKVTDFGIAKAATSNTITSNVMGSVHYTSPEQARGGFSDEKSDIYSLGCTMFEMLTGHVPFDGETTVAIAIKHIQEDMPSPREFVSEIPVSVEQIIFKATQKSPDRRYQSMGELIEDLKHSLIAPDEDFVKIIPVEMGGATRVITEADISEIKDRTGTIAGINIIGEEKDSAPRPAKRKPVRKIEEPEEEDEEEEDDEEYEDDDLDPKMERITTILAIVAAVIIGIIALALVANALDIFKTGSGSDSKDNTEEQTQEETQLVMINVVGKDLETAKKELNDMGLGTRVSTQESDEYEENIVISQGVNEGEKVEKYTTIDLIVSSGTEGIEVDNVTGMEAELAARALEEKGFKVVRDYANDDAVEKDRVISQEPSAGSKAAKGSSVTLLISQGKAIKETTVPDLRGMTESAAKAKLEEYKLKCGTVSETHNDTVSAGCVVTQSYNPGLTVSEGTVVDITLSLGAKELTYKYVTTLQAPTGYTGGSVTITIKASDGDVRTFSTSTFPCAVNETGFKVNSGTISYTFTRETDPEIDPDDGYEVVAGGTETVTTPEQAITFTQE
ncbi:MAG: Stk1 family PASTA domain-containing Ser/Thr kinase [Roseburia sp.]|nr:Stk1 family PASTA domain-containing Ser/Thr kinase [Roseburia sp.]MCM1278528.1 Stk1 family PASTA domain-containing Ser/Thr kinase [Robinsoniella sp.]